MAGVDIDPFGEHDKTDSHPDEIGTNIPLPLVTSGRDLLGSQNANKKHCLEGERARKRNFSKNASKRCIMCYLKKLAKPQMHSISMISNSEMESCTTGTKEHH